MGHPQSWWRRLNSRFLTGEERRFGMARSLGTVMLAGSRFLAGLSARFEMTGFEGLAARLKPRPFKATACVGSEGLLLDRGDGCIELPHGG